MASTLTRLSVGSLLVLGCSSSDTAPPLPLEDCIPGVWVATDACETCTGSYVTPECDASDCTEGNTLVLASDGTALDFNARWSWMDGTLRVVLGCGAELESTWYVDGGNVLVQDYARTSFAAEVHCTETMLQREGMRAFSRADPPLSEALARVTDAEECVVPLAAP